ncbi:hypothetical protein [Trinickia dinghuensis]|uniref:Uncharacterized protein n=1 Tax=Trinickia dinghuensis TaxID=2291023 RepID=A0A3D8JZF8_9BURK|nr:hypothetical protein [Trinickia dinghuensis]RDU98212.1 hypothetical protein DWV00_12860 [Trinickia dinghuensis]
MGNAYWRARASDAEHGYARKDIENVNRDGYDELPSRGFRYCDSRGMAAVEINLSGAFYQHEPPCRAMKQWIVTF